MSKNLPPQEEKPAYMLYAGYVEGNSKPALAKDEIAVPDSVGNPEQATGWNVFRPCTPEEKIRFDEERSNGFRLLTILLEQGSTEDLDYIYDKLSRRCPLGKKQARELTTLQEEKAAAVKDAVADVLRQIRQPVYLSLLASGRYLVHLGINEERTRTNEAADTLAKSYGVDLGEWPETSSTF